MENMENVVMDGEVMTENSADATNAGVGKKVGIILLVGAGVGLAVKGAIWLGKKVKGAIVSKKTAEADVVVKEYDEVPCEEAE